MNDDLRKDQPQNEEVDLGQLFNAIGRLFSRFYRFIGRIFTGLFGVVVLFLLFIQKHFVKLVAVVVVGVILGTILDIKKEPLYVSTMVIEPNFNSVQQLYNNVGFYKELAKAKDSLSLSEALNITTKEAISIKNFSVESYSDENQKIVLFDRFVRSLDSTTKKAIDMKAYLKNFNSFDARFHTISVTASDNTVAKRIQPAIISSISNNSYFNLQKNISDSNIKLQDSLYKKQIAEIDSLQLLYKKVMLKEAERAIQGTNISLGETGEQNNKELSLINKMDELKIGLVELNNERGNKSSILNVISDFPRKGVRDSGILKSNKFLIPVLFLIVTALVLLLLSLNKYLKNYKRK
ncbi:hypothetical protein [Gelidibacter pelagius]|uniref:Subunit length determinant protein n=1 Tax=Gelidibacter pelagius TaxID=2819985 RepID=A0ABS3SM95_9FLAO|nr:hypothetical protein [Gelidibacter pelagius]MBO3096754.1 hypothetical protein [Gelidibacter pelagius]